MTTSAAVETGLDKLNTALKEMEARCYCESTPVSHGCIRDGEALLHPEVQHHCRN